LVAFLGDPTLGGDEPIQFGAQTIGLGRAPGTGVDLRADLGDSYSQRGTHVVAVIGEEVLHTGPGTRQRVLVVTCLLQVCDVAGDLVQDPLVHGRQCLGQDTDQFARVATAPDGGASE